VSNALYGGDERNRYDNEVKIIKKLNPKLVPGSVAIINCDTQDIMSRIEEMSPETCKKLE